MNDNTGQRLMGAGDEDEGPLRPTGLALPMDVAVEMRLEGFAGAFPNLTLQDLVAHVESYFDWALQVPRLQLKMVELATAASGQRPA